MKINGKNTGLFRLWLAGLVIFSHEIIPHHHHFHSAYTSSHLDHEGGCGHDHENDSSSDSTENHCHAFNDITVERQTVVKISQPQIYSFPGLFVAPFYLTDGPVSDEGVNYYCKTEFSDRDDFILFPVLRRGPPLI